MNRTPAVLIVDDEIDGAVRGLQGDLRRKKVSAEVFTPEELTLTALKRADLVLVDSDLAQWQEVRGLPPSRAPSDGLALLSVLRRHLSRIGGSPTAFAIYTGQLDDLASPLPPENRRHILAGLNNLEWVFGKGDVNVVDQVASLARATLKLPRLTARSIVTIDNWLGVDGPPALASRLRGEVASCNPPIHEVTQWSHGIALVRWLAHRILPYPCFLWDSCRVAARLRITHRSFLRAISDGTKLNTELAAFRYRGALDDFLGPRWWRAGIERWLWTITEGNSVLAAEVFKSVHRITKGRVERLRTEEPVTLVDENYRLIADPMGSDTAVRVQPDDWPVFAEPPWMLRSEVEANPKFAALVVKDEGRF